MGILDWIIVIAIAIGVVLSIRRMVKRGGGCSCSSCSSCSSCIGSCDSCKDRCSQNDK